MKVQRGYQTELNPSNIQRTLFLKNAGAARWAYNWGLQQKKLAMDAKTKIPNNIELHRQLNALKQTDIPWAYECSKCSFQESLRNLDKAFDNFFRKCKLKKQGKFKGKVGFPRFKSKRKGIGGFRLTGTIKVMSDRIQLPRLGTIRLKERNYLPTDAKILNASVKERAGRWYVAVQVEMEMPDSPVKPVAIVGVDLGIKTLATCSDSEVFENPKALGKNLKRLKKLRRLVSRKEKGSKNRRKAADRLATFHKKVSDIRKDVLHKVTTHLTKTKSVVVIEDKLFAGYYNTGMGKKLDLTGEVFGSLTVVRLEKIGDHGKEYRCQCQCGNYKVYRGSTLTSGSVKGCGCHKKFGKGNVEKLQTATSQAKSALSRHLRYERIAKAKVGQKYHRLKVVDVELSSNGRRYNMICECECAQMTTQCYADIKSGKVKSCGCHQREMASMTGSSVGYKNAKNNRKWSHQDKDGQVVRMRSGYEVMFAEIMDKDGIKWDYEPMLFKLKDGMRYRPDFHLPDLDEWIEVKGWYSEKDKAKVEEFQKQGHKVRVVQLAEIEKHHALSYQQFLKLRCPA